MTKTNNRSKNREQTAASAPSEDNVSQTSRARSPAIDGDHRALALQAGLEGTSALTALPEDSLNREPTADELSNVVPKPTTEAKPEEAANKATHGGLPNVNMREVITTLREFAEDTHQQYDSLDGELQLAMAWQEQLAKQQQEVFRRIDMIKQKAQNMRLVFAQNLETAQEMIASESSAEPLQHADRLSYNVSPAGIAPPRESPAEDDVVSYASPAPTPNLEKLRLFRPRSLSETTDDYQRRVSKQHYVLARDHYEDGVRQRDAKAERTWKDIVANNPEPVKLEQEGARGTPIVHLSPYHQDPTSVEPPTPWEPSIRRSPTPAPDINKPVMMAGGGGGHRNGNGGPPGGSPPPSSSGDGDHPAPHDDTPRRVTPVERQRPFGRDTAGRGYSPSYLPTGRETDYFLSSDRDDPNTPYIDKQLEIIRAAIWERVGREFSTTPAMKNLKNVPPPEKYAGDDDSEAFLSWLKSFLRWLALGRIVGPDLDADHVQLLGQHLTKEARSWYDDAVDNFSGIGRHWTFEQTICTLFRRFIHKSTARLAADRFQKVKYSRETGVSGLYDSLMALARKMPELPYDYSFKQRFIDALPEEICAPMLRNRNISIERSDPWAIRRAALQQEENNRALEDWHTHRRPTKEAERNSRPTERTGPPLRPHSSLNRTTYFNRAPAMKTTNEQGPGNRKEPGRMATAPATTTRVMLGVKTPARPAVAGPSGARSSSRPVSSSVQCYNCKDYGHMSAQCPKAQVPRLRAARVVEPGETAGHDGDDTIESGSPGDPGANTEGAIDAVVDDIPDDDALYKSAEEFYDLDGSQYDPDSLEPAAFSDTEDTVWFGSMRVTIDTDDEAAVDYPANGRVNPRWTSSCRLCHDTATPRCGEPCDQT